MSRELRADEQPTVSGKHLTFCLSKEQYALSIRNVQEIVGALDVTVVPQTPHYVLGVVNLRGKIIPVVDLRAKFGMPASVATAETCTIVVETSRAEMGLLVDRVCDVVAIDASVVDPPPTLGLDIDTKYLRGIGKVEGRVQLILDIEQVLRDADLPQHSPSNESPDAEQVGPTNED